MEIRRETFQTKSGLKREMVLVEGFIYWEIGRETFQTEGGLKRGLVSHQGFSCTFSETGTLKITLFKNGILLSELHSRLFKIKILVNAFFYTKNANGHLIE